MNQTLFTSEIALIDSDFLKYHQLDTGISD